MLGERTAERSAWLGLAFYAAALVGCREPELFVAPTCAADATSAAPVPAQVTYHGHVRPLFEQRCWPCHKQGDIAPFALESYATAKVWSGAIAYSVGNGRMPPWQAGPCCRPYRHDTSLSASEKKLIEAWVQQGAEEGDPAQYKAPPAQKESGLSRVDLALKGPTYTPKAKFGQEELRCFLLDVPLTDTTFITGFNVRPGNSQIVHHVLLNIIHQQFVGHFQSLDARDAGPGWDCYGQGLSAAHGVGIGGWAPGFRGLDYPSGLGIRVQAGAKLLMAVHYDVSHGSGVDATTAEFSTAKTVERDVVNLGLSHPLWLISGGMAIPAGDKDVVRTFRYDPTTTIGDGKSLNVYAANIHMHEFGSRASLVIERADGSRECLLYIPKYDVGWQQTYFFEQSTTIRPGDVLYLECHWDNTDANQPTLVGKKAPARDLQWGTDKEMCTAFVMMARP